jgi:DNA-binding IclR family transcriptional regulator
MLFTLPRNPSEKKKFGVQSVEIGLRILSVIAEAYRPLMLRELSQAVDMPPAKVHRYLVSLIRSGMVEQESAGGRYGLGQLAVNVGLAALNRLDLVEIAGAAITDLRDRIDRTTMLAVWGLGGPTIVRWEDCRRPIVVNVRVGSVLRLLDSATGLVFAAFLPRSVTKAVFTEEMREHHSDREREAIERLLVEVRERGMSRVQGKQLASVNALSVPLFDHTKKIVAAMTVLGSERQVSVDWNGPIAKELRAVAHQVSRRMGCVTAK